jgi:peptide/nickel transport system permease protein
MTARVRLALGALVLAHCAVLLAGYLAPYPYAEQHRDYPYAAPMRIHFRGLHPFVYGLAGDHARVYPLRLFPGTHRLFGVDGPGVVFLLGTDGFGRDVFSRLLYGARISLFTGLMAAAVSLGLGLLLGTAAGYYGGAVDQILMRGSELFLALPWLYLLLGIRAFLPLHISTLETVALLVVMIGCLGWVRPARLVRGVILSGKERAFVAAARGFGASDVYLIRRHLLPLTWGVILTQATVLIPRYVLAEVTLSFVGLGIGEPVPSWGNMLAEAREYSSVVSHFWLLAPGLALIPVLLAYLALADAFLEADNP